jgi:hypothetical protein
MVLRGFKQGLKGGRDEASGDASFFKPNHNKKKPPLEVATGGAGGAGGEGREGAQGAAAGAEQAKDNNNNSKVLVKKRSMASVALSFEDVDVELDEDTLTKQSQNSIFLYSLVITLLYMAMGILMICLMEGWAFVDGFYFIVVTLTTVGYGDINGYGDMTQWGIMLLSLYTLFGILLVGTALGIIAATLLEKQDAALRDAMQTAMDEDHSIMHSPKNRYRLSSVAHSISGVLKSGADTIEKLTSREFRQLLPSFGVLAFMLAMGMVVIHFDDKDLTAVECFYYAVITSTTIGYGDISPGTSTGRIVGSFYLLITVTATGNVLGSIAGSVIERKQRQAMEKILHKRITIDDFAKFDLDGDGRVEKSEFIIQKLILMKLLDPADVRRCEAEFEIMDEDDSGEITLSDLEIFLQKKAEMKALMKTEGGGSAKGSEGGCW